MEMQELAIIACARLPLFKKLLLPISVAIHKKEAIY
jgi:hypothetical protein